MNCPYCQSDDIAERELSDGYSKLVCGECEANAITDNRGWIEWASYRTLRRAHAAQTDADKRFES